jgi:hypothetical protein
MKAKIKIFRVRSDWFDSAKKLLLITAVFTASIDLVLATPDIDIEFEEEQGVSSEWIRAKASCHTTSQQLHEVIDAIVEYPVLHSWIQGAEIETDDSSGAQIILVEFVFPWPVGEQWSRIEVKKENESTITWHQLEGSLGMNSGRVVITEYEQEAYVDYRANIDVGYANVLTREYKEEFVTEFLMAIYDATRTSSGPFEQTAANDSHISISVIE